jgi:predicted dehydrogenase
MGTGAIAARFASDLKRLPDAELFAVASREQGRAAAFGRRFSAPNAYGSYQELVSDARVDAIYVATPASEHRASCLMCLSAKKPVLCEKPFANSLSDAQAIAQAARDNGTFCMEAMWTRFAPILSEAKSLIASGAIGQVTMASFQLGFAYAFDASHRLYRPELGGGALLDFGVYPLSLSSYFFGRPETVVASAIRGPTGVDEQFVAVLSCAHHIQVTVAASLRNRTSNDALIMGERGVIRISEPLYMPHVLQIVPHGKLPLDQKETRLGLLKALAHPAIRKLAQRVLRPPRTVRRPVDGLGYHLEAAEVGRCLKQGLKESPLLPLSETLSVMETVEAIRSQLGGPEKVQG